MIETNNMDLVKLAEIFCFILWLGGCEVHAFDPYDGGKSENISFHLHNHNISSSDDPDKGMFQLKTLLKTNHHINKTVSVLSLNIFGAEHDVLPAILNEGGLENVVQLTVSVYHTSVTRVAGLRINVLDVPEVAQAGHTVRLTCDYDLERARLYQVKWYKGSHEFFRYSPFDEQKIKVFTVEGLNIDLKQSDDRTVVLRDLPVDMTGRYTCEVSTEKIFETAMAKANMTVIELPRGGPHIQGYDREVRLGDILNLNCTSLKSKPAAELKFFINGKRAERRPKVFELQKYLIVNEDRHEGMPTGVAANSHQTESAILSMKFRVRRYHIKSNQLRVTCRASILGAYQRNRTVEMLVQEPQQPHYTSSDTNIATTTNLIHIFTKTNRFAEGASASTLAHGLTLHVVIPLLSYLINTLTLN